MQWFHLNLFPVGDYSPLLKIVNQELEKAKEYAANEYQKSALTYYIESFRTGSLEAHKVT